MSGEAETAALRPDDLRRQPGRPGRRARRSLPAWADALSVGADALSAGRTA
jgi:hypothetical protein